MNGWRMIGKVIRTVLCCYCVLQFCKMICIHVNGEQFLCVVRLDFCKFFLTRASLLVLGLVFVLICISWVLCVCLVVVIVWLSIRCRSWLPERTCLPNDLLRVKWDVRHYSLSHCMIHMHAGDDSFLFLKHKLFWLSLYMTVVYLLLCYWVIDVCVATSLSCCQPFYRCFRFLAMLLWIIYLLSICHGNVALICFCVVCGHLSPCAFNEFRVQYAVTVS